MKAATLKCYTCKQRKPRSDFLDRGKCCQACRDADASRVNKQASSRARYVRDRDAILSGNADWKQRNRAAYRDQQRAYAKQKRVAVRTEVIATMGGGCACCGEAEPLFLTIDHIDGNGNAHRRIIGKTDMWAWMKASGYPPGFQLLCYNCNAGKHRNGGTCPHVAMGK